MLAAPVVLDIVQVEKRGRGRRLAFRLPFAYARLENRPKARKTRVLRVQNGSFSASPSRLCTLDSSVPPLISIEVLGDAASWHHLDDRDVRVWSERD